MKTTLQLIAEKAKQKERAERDAIKAEIANPKTPNDRRSFLKKAALGGIALGGLMHLSVEDTIAQTTQNVSRASSPSDLKITDLRVAQKGSGGGFASRIIKIYTNQGLTGIGDIRDGTDQRFALFLKSKIVGLNPCNVEMIFKVIKQFGGHGRQGGGVSAVEMACWDLCGKALNVPVWQLLGGRYRDKMRLYADTPDGRDDADQLARIKNRIEVEGFTWLKMDLSAAAVASANPGSMVNGKYWRVGQPRPAAPQGAPQGQAQQGQRPAGQAQAQPGQRPGGFQMPQASMEQYMSYNNTEHPFTQIQLTDKGIELMAERVHKVRDMIGFEIPLATDHFGYMDENQFIRLAKAVEPHRLAWLEDTVPWFYHDRLKALKEASTTPICTGEDIYMLGGMLGGFKSLIDDRCVDIIHPDLVSAGGILETKKIGDYAEEAGIPMAMHHNSSPVAFMANVHCAAATENALVLEFHGGDMLKDWEDNVIKTDGKPLMENGFGLVPLTAPGLGIELNDEKIKSGMPKDAKYFDATPEWDAVGRPYDKLWI
jgi:L-alanine-DL-glutamate epimerase-like enolase superfamily enzyme